MWLGLLNEIKFWFIRTFKTRKCIMPKGDTEFSWASDDDIPQWVKDTDKSQWTFEIPCDYYITDELGGVHTDGVGYAPDGRFCGECTRESCKGCWDKQEEIKQNIKTLFQDKEQYYKLSTLYDLAYEDDVNGNCDGKVDVGVVACLTSADVAPVVHGEWKRVSDYWTCSNCCTVTRSKDDEYCRHCGARMDGGNK